MRSILRLPDITDKEMILVGAPCSGVYQQYIGRQVPSPPSRHRQAVPDRSFHTVTSYSLQWVMYESLLLACGLTTQIEQQATR